MIPEAYKEYINQLANLTEKETIKWESTDEQEYTYRAENATFIIAYYLDEDMEKSFYSILFLSKTLKVRDGFRVANDDSDYQTMENLYQSARRSAQDVKKNLELVFSDLHRKEVISKLNQGEAKVLELNNNKRINVGVIRIEDNNLVYYTGKGLREIFKPLIKTEEERKAVDELENKDEEIGRASCRERV